MLNTFLALLQSARAVSVDDSPLLTDFMAEELLNDPDNQIVRFTWTDGEHDYAEVLTEGGIAAGMFDSDGNFVCENCDGETSHIRFFALECLSAHAGKHAAQLFFTELLDSVEHLVGVIEEHGSRTLADLMYLQNAILNNGHINHYPESRIHEIVSILPSAQHWLKFIKQQASPAQKPRTL